MAYRRSENSDIAICITDSGHALIDVIEHRWSLITSWSPKSHCIVCCRETVEMHNALPVQATFVIHNHSSITGQCVRM